MIVQKTFSERLKQDFHLNIYEVKIWTALLSRGIATAGELADISGVPRSRCYDVLESLEKKSFILMKIGKPIKYIAVQPEEIIDRVKKNLNSEKEINLNILDSIKDTDVFKEIELLHKTGIEHVDVTKLTDSIVGRDNIASFMKNFVAKAKKSVLIATTADGFSRKITALKNVLPGLSNKGVKIKLVAPVDQKISKKAQKLAKLVDVNPGIRFISVDNKEVLFMLSDDNINPKLETAVYVDSAFFAQSLTKMFENNIIN